MKMTNRTKLNMNDLDKVNGGYIFFNEYLNKWQSINDNTGETMGTYDIEMNDILGDMGYYNAGVDCLEHNFSIEVIDDKQVCNLRGYLADGYPKPSW